MKIPIRHMSFARKWCIAFAHRLEPERIFVILTAYLDESGTHDGYHYQAGSSGLRAGAGCLNSFSASISGASAGVRLPSGEAAA